MERSAFKKHIFRIFANFMLTEGYRKWNLRVLLTAFLLPYFTKYIGFAPFLEKIQAKKISRRTFLCDHDTGQTDKIFTEYVIRPVGGFQTPV